MKPTSRQIQEDVNFIFGLARQAPVGADVHDAAQASLNRLAHYLEGAFARDAKDAEEAKSTGEPMFEDVEDAA